MAYVLLTIFALVLIFVIQSLYRNNIILHKINEVYKNRHQKISQKYQILNEKYADTCRVDTIFHRCDSLYPWRHSSKIAVYINCSSDSCGMCIALRSIPNNKHAYCIFFGILERNHIVKRHPSCLDSEIDGKLAAIAKYELYEKNISIFDSLPQNTVKYYYACILEDIRRETCGFYECFNGYRPLESDIIEKFTSIKSMLDNWIDTQSVVLNVPAIEIIKKLEDLRNTGTVSNFYIKEKLLNDKELSDIIAKLYR